jgi:hypothetical protein
MFERHRQVYDRVLNHPDCCIRIPSQSHVHMQDFPLSVSECLDHYVIPSGLKAHDSDRFISRVEQLGCVGLED